MPARNDIVTPPWLVSSRQQAAGAREKKSGRPETMQARGECSRLMQCMRIQIAQDIRPSFSPSLPCFASCCKTCIACRGERNEDER
jgi:hypothetical protein